MHLRQAEVTEEKNSSGPSRATATGSYVQPARSRAELSLFSSDFEFVTLRGRARQSGPPDWETVAEKGRGFSNFSATECRIVQPLKYLAIIRTLNSPLHLRRAASPPSVRALTV